MKIMNDDGIANNDLNDVAGCWLLAADTVAGAVAAAPAADLLAIHRPW